MLMDILLIILKVILWFIAIVFFFRLSNKIVIGSDEYFDVLFNKISELYGIIRKCFCKKGSKVYDDRRAVQDDGESYDSSSIWED
jgi:SPX domain protein involved in polyphosphate accumulation